MRDVQSSAVSTLSTIINPQRAKLSLNILNLKGGLGNIYRECKECISLFQLNSLYTAVEAVEQVARDGMYS